MKSKFKVGNIVTVYFIDGSDGYDYPYNFAPDMRVYHGRQFRISDKRKCFDPTEYSKSKYYDFYDGYVYTLEYGLVSSWSWSSSMFLESMEI